MVTSSRLRTFRTLFVHRWHASQTIGEWFGNDDIGFRFEHVNHARSLAEYVWRYGPFSESPEGTERIPVPGASSLRSIVRPVARKGRRHFGMAVRYAAMFGRAGPAARALEFGASEPDPRDRLRLIIESRRRVNRAAETKSGRAVLQYASEHPSIEEFAAHLLDLHHAMLPFYVQMRYVTAEEADAYSIRGVPVLAPLGGADGARWKYPDDIAGARALSGDLVAILRGTFACNIYTALACRARAELFESLADHPEGDHIAVQTDGPERWGPQGVATAIVGGERRRFAVHDGALAAMLDSIAEKPMPALIRWLTAFRIAVSTMITAMPVFIIKNFFRDTLSGFVAGRYWQLPVLGTLLGGLHATHDLVTGRSRRMRDYLLQGGFYSGLVESEVDLTDTRARTPGTMAGSAGRGWSRLIYVLTRPAWIAEAGTRVNQFRGARRRRATGYEAARAARMVSSDFANIGASRGWRMYVHTVPFLNAAIQGLDQLYQIGRFRSRRNRSSPLWGSERRRHVAKTLASGLLLSAAAWAAWEHNQSRGARREAYANQTDYEKASWVTLYDVDFRTDFRIPVPFQVGALFIKLPEVALDIAHGSGTQAGPKFVWSLVHGNLAVGWIPAVAQPFVEVYSNRNFFGEPIIPAYMRSWPRSEQYFRRSTSLPYRKAGAAMGVSPLHVKTFVRAWTGHLGHAVVAVLDEEVLWNRRAHGAKPFQKAKSLWTGIHSLQPTSPRAYTRTSNEFYETADWLDGEMAAARRNRRMPSREMGVGQGLSQRARKHVSHLRRQSDEIRVDRRLTAVAKERRIEELYARIDEVLREALPRMRLARRGGGEGR